MLIERFDENPLIVPADIGPTRQDFEVVCAFNPGVARYNDETVLLLRVAQRPSDKRPDEEVAPIYNIQTGDIDLLRVSHSDPAFEQIDSRIFRYKGQMYLTSISHLQLARSKDGKNFQIDTGPTIFPAGAYETYGLEDARITQIQDEYLITCKAVSANGICTALFKTSDFKNFQRFGIIFFPEATNVVIFPEKIDGLFYAFIRPIPFHMGPLAIWTVSSPDLLHWGRCKISVCPRANMFDSKRVGASCVPIRTEHGWLEIYHGANAENRYALAAVLLDLTDPSKEIARSSRPILQPEAEYEKSGFFADVVFSGGAIAQPDGKITIYYGAADTSTAGAQTSINEILSTLE